MGTEGLVGGATPLEECGDVEGAVGLTRTVVEQSKLACTDLLSERGNSTGTACAWEENSDYAPSDNPCDDYQSQCSGPAEEGECEWEMVPLEAEELQEELQADDELEDVTDLQAETEFEDGNDVEDEEDEEDEDAADGDDEEEGREVADVENGSEMDAAIADRLGEDNATPAVIGQASDVGGLQSTCGGVVTADAALKPKK